MTLDSALFRKTMGCFATGVTVVAVPSGDGVHGMTANAFSSVSLDPPLVLVCVNRKARTHDVLLQARRFGVSFLGVGQQDVSNHFAGRPDPGVEARLSYKWVDGCPVLEPNVGYLACRLKQTYDGGDHTIFIGEVTGLSPGEGEPLIFLRGRYRQLQPEPLNQQ